MTLPQINVLGISSDGTFGMQQSPRKPRTWLTILLGISLIGSLHFQRLPFSCQLLAYLSSATSSHQRLLDIGDLEDLLYGRNSLRPSDTFPIVGSVFEHCDGIQLPWEFCH